ncbi:MAG TPA: metallophosphoesterase [Thermoanaerobaculia bacterium]|jgi:hypothetical protein|nr:metallophosphoesterase [Thermoanaerobaculia bacterium]
MKRRFCAAAAVGVGLVLLFFTGGPVRGQDASPAGTWYFAFSGDSRDCGDLIMPKIARDIEGLRATAPVELYWHLGDFRRLYGPDCDIVKRTHPDWDCKKRPEGELGSDEMNRYLDGAWDDFIERQVAPFGSTPVFLGIGNHELAAGRTRDVFRRKFQQWLTSGPIHLQRIQDSSKRFYTTEGDTYYHFVRNGVDFIYLDNADEESFSADQLNWLAKVLANDAADPTVKTIVAGMHEALPYSKQRGHAMDATCQGLCSGEQAYDLLYRAQQIGGKHVYVFASHSHLFVEDAFGGQPEHTGQVLPGWVVGTAGAEQYRQEADPIQYGYALATVHPDGTLDVAFREVKRDSPPLAAGPGADQLTAFCFEKNKRAPSDSSFKGICACGAAEE